MKQDLQTTLNSPAVPGPWLHLTCWKSQARILPGPQWLGSRAVAGIETIFFQHEDAHKAPQYPRGRFYRAPPLYRGKQAQRDATGLPNDEALSGNGVI